MSTANISHDSASRYTGLVAMILLLFSVMFPPFSGSATLLEAIRPSLLSLLRGSFPAETSGLIMVVGVIGFLLLLLGVLLGMVFFFVRPSPRKALVGMILCTVGLLVITGTLFDYTGDVRSRIVKATQVGIWPSLEFYGTGYFLAWITVIAGLLSARRPAPPRTKQIQRVPVVQRPRPQVVEGVVSTGYTALDNILYGGLPVGGSVVLTGPPCDEKDLIVRRFVETNLQSNRGCVFMSTSLDGVRDLVAKYGKRLQVIVCNPQADTIASAFPDVVKLRAVDSLTQVNLEYENAAAKVGGSAVLCIEILDDVMLEHHDETRRWLMDILGRTRAKQMTCLATLNSAMHPAEESQAVLETFDGHIDLFEAEIQVRPKLIRVRKLRGRKFLDEELRVEKGKI